MSSGCIQMDSAEFRLHQSVTSNVTCRLVSADVTVSVRRVNGSKLGKLLQVVVSSPQVLSVTDP